MEFRGEFETHITVRLEAPAGVEALRRWGEQTGWSCVHIVLDRGTCVSQPMLTQRRHGMLSTVLEAATAYARELEEHGFPVSRIKIEAGLENEDVPSSAREATSTERYFEHHVKLLLGPEEDLPALAALAEQHAAHLSRNALRQRTDGQFERFVTQRCWSGGRKEARRHLDALLSALATLGHPVLDVEEELTVYDSNATVDAGWIQREE